MMVGLHLLGKNKKEDSLNFFKKFFKRKTAYDPKKDSLGRTIANRQGVDDRPNEPLGCVAPPVRFEDERQRKDVHKIYREKIS